LKTGALATPVMSCPTGRWRSAMGRRDRAGHAPGYSSNSIAGLAGQTGRLPIRHVDAVELARVLRVLSNPIRLQVVRLVADSPAGWACAVDVADALAFAGTALAHHFKALVDAGLPR